MSRLTGQREEAARTADLLRTELRVALEALHSQRREEELRLRSSSDTRLHVSRVRERRGGYLVFCEATCLMVECCCLYRDPLVWIA